MVGTFVPLMQQQAKNASELAKTWPKIVRMMRRFTGNKDMLKEGSGRRHDLLRCRQYFIAGKRNSRQ